MSGSAFETIVVERRDGGIHVATLNRPERANAMTSTMFDELARLVQDVADDEGSRALVLTGAGRAFCAGYDIDAAKELATMSGIAFLRLQERAANALRTLRALRVPVIAAVNGVAAGGGMALALACDIRIGSPTARFNAAFVRIGLSAGDLGTSWLLPRLIGPAKASEIAFTGRMIGAEEAERIGLLNSVSAEDGALEDALAMAAAICANSPRGVELSKRALQANLEIPSYGAAMELENRGQALLTRTADMPEALAAFTERRSPSFTGE